MDGIYICGSARWPTDVSEGIAQAYAATSKAAGPLRMGYVRVEAINASVNEDECSGCGICELPCPFQVRLLNFRLEMRKESPISMKQYARVVALAVLPAFQELSPCTTLLMSKFWLK